MGKILIAPSILSADFSKLGDDIRSVEAAGADWIHIDVMDGHFVPNLTMGPVVVKSIRPVTRLPLDVHLMIDEPHKYVESFAKAGADIITFHIEAEKAPEKVIKLIRSFGKKVGVSVRPKTSVSSLRSVVGLVDMVLIMTVEPGFGGQSFMPECAPKIAEAKKMFGGDIQVDGGINLDNVAEVVKYGANIIVAGTAVFGVKDRTLTIKRLKGE